MLMSLKESPRYIMTDLSFKLGSVFYICAVYVCGVLLVGVVYCKIVFIV